jgi:hypothetical protein
MALAKRLPTLKQLAPVYAIIVIFTYSWSLFQFFWRVPSWQNFSSLGEILVMLSYLITVNFMESLLLLFCITLVLMMLPISWGYDQFLVKGSLLVVILLGFLAYRNQQVYPSKVLFELSSRQWALWLGIQALILFAPLKKFPAVNRIVEEIADRLVIFLYIFIPVSLVSVAVVLLRNIV